MWYLFILQNKRTSCITLHFYSNKPRKGKHGLHGCYKGLISSLLLYRGGTTHHAGVSLYKNYATLDLRGHGALHWSLLTRSNAAHAIKDYRTRGIFSAFSHLWVYIAPRLSFGKSTISPCWIRTVLAYPLFADVETPI